jgi:acetylornithine deacetylase/succinyl-diaminopimelate desuccinylase-like protein
LNLRKDTDSLPEMISLLSKLIKNQCVNPPGNEMKSIKTIKHYLEVNGIKSQIFESAPNRGNLLAIIKGKKDRPSLMFGPSHVDVAPVKSKDTWEVPPFSGIVREDFVWGRGALDMLFIVVAQVQAFIEIHKTGLQLNGDLILLLVCDEENEGKYGTEWMLNNYPEHTIPDYAVTEAGGWPIGKGTFALTIGEEKKTDLAGDESASSELVSPTDTIFVETMEKVVQKIIPNSKLIPSTMPGRTDAYFLRKMGSHVYGFALFDPATTSDELKVHDVDEKIRIETLELTKKAYYHLAEDFLT